MSTQTSTAIPQKERHISAWKDFVRSHIQTLSIIGVLFLVCLIFGVSTESFFSWSNGMNMIQQLAPNLIVVVAMTFVITTGGIDLSVGSILALASALTATMLDSGVGSFITLLVVLMAGVLVGLLNGYITAFHGIPPFIVTLAAMIYIRGLALFITGGYSIAIMSEHWLVGMGQGSVAGIPVSVFIAIVIMVLGAVVLTQTRYGNYVTGIGANEEAVRRSGISTKKIKLLTYTFSGVSASLAGLIIASRLGSGSSNIGFMFELDIIAAVVIGGTALFGGKGTMIGSLVGVTLIGVINNGLTLMHVSPYLIQIIEGLVLLAAVLINIRVFGNRN